MSKSILSFTLNVIPRTKKNSSQYIPRLHRLVPSKNYRLFEQECLSLIEEELKMKIDRPITIKAHFYCNDRRRRDLTNLLEALDDMLVKAEVIEDDCRDIIASHDGSRVYYDKERPRIEVWIEEFNEEYTIWRKN